MRVGPSDFTARKLVPIGNILLRKRLVSSSFLSAYESAISAPDQFLRQLRLGEIIDKAKPLFLYMVFC
jgi:hypothetical protein